MASQALSETFDPSCHHAKGCCGSSYYTRVVIILRVGMTAGAFSR